MRNHDKQKNFKAKRREFIELMGLLGVGAVAVKALDGNALAAPEEIKIGDRKPFFLTIHLGSMCSIASGLVQPLSSGKWPKGFFEKGELSSAANPLLNEHTTQGEFVFHDYNKLLAEVASDMCLVNGNPGSLDHNVAKAFQLNGTEQKGSGPEWGMAVAEHSKTPQNKSPLVISNALKTHSVPSVSMMVADGIETFIKGTSDDVLLPKKEGSAFNKVLKQRFNQKKFGTLKPSAGLGETVGQQLLVLEKGFPAIEAAKAQIALLRTALNEANFKKTAALMQDGANIKYDKKLAESLILAGALSITGLGSAMTAGMYGHDYHFGYADTDSPRVAGGVWILVTAFWKWVKSQGLDEDVTVMVTQEFGRGPYNDNRGLQPEVIVKGVKKKIVSPGRDHGFFMGSLFLNRNVPSMKRIGNVLDNFVPVGGSSKTGGYNPDIKAYKSVDIVGSMLMRLYPGLFPSERIVRKHWPDFKEVTEIFES